MLYVLHDYCDTAIYGVFDTLEKAIEKSHELAEAELNYYMNIDPEGCETVYNICTLEDQEKIDRGELELQNSSGYAAYLAEWEDGFLITEIELNTLKVGGYLEIT